MAMSRRESHEDLSRAEQNAKSRGPLLELCAADYDLSGIWRNRVPHQPSARVPEGVEYDAEERAFLMDGGDVVTVPLATNPHVLREASYAVWVKVRTNLSSSKNLAWILSQYPDYGWSRAVTLNDYRLGYVSVTTSRFWDCGLDRAPVGEWIHVVGVWSTSGATAYLNGVKGNIAADVNNAKSSAVADECLIIGGRGPHDQAHNASVLVSDVSVFDWALSETEAQLLHRAGRPSSTSYQELSCVALGLVGLTTPIDAFGEPRSMQADREIDENANSDEDRCAAQEEPPIWEEASGLFWCATGVSAYDLPDGEEWQHSFRQAVEQSQVAKRRTLRKHVSDAPAPEALTPHNRKLARHPSDPDKRAERSAHTEALLQMSSRSGVQRRVHGRRIALFRFHGRVFAVDADCPHQGAALCEGEIGDIEDMVEGRRYYVRCSVHKFQFDLCTGVVIDGHCPPLRTYKARIRDANDPQKVPTIEVGFQSLPEGYFCPSDDVDF